MAHRMPHIFNITDISYCQHSNPLSVVVVVVVVVVVFLVSQTCSTPRQSRNKLCFWQITERVCDSYYPFRNG